LTTPTAPSVETPGLGGGRHLRPDQAVEAEREQHHADAEPQTMRRRPAQNLTNDGHAYCSTDQKRRKSRQLYRLAQFPYRAALHDQTKGGDQDRTLGRRQEVQPDGHRHDRKRKTRQARAKRRGKGAPHLVADFRVDRRPRRFPRRDRLSSDILAAHGAAIAPSALRRDLWQALTTPHA
jgi:hypothetical protein